MPSASFAIATIVLVVPKRFRWDFLRVHKGQNEDNEHSTLALDCFEQENREIRENDDEKHHPKLKQFWFLGFKTVTLGQIQSSI